MEILLRAVTAYGRDRCAIFAAGVTYYALISLFPLVIFIVSVSAFFVTEPADQQRLIDELMGALPLSEGGGRQGLADAIDGVVSNRGALGVFGLAATAYAAGALFTNVRGALNSVFQVEQQRPFIRGKAVDLTLVAGFGLLLLASFTLTVVIAFVQRQADAIVGEDLGTLVAWLANLAYLFIPPLVTSLVFLLLYTTIARVGYTPRDVAPGVILAALLFEVLKIGFAQYVASFGNYDATYGTLGFVIILLLFFNFSAQVMLLGAEVARANVEVRELERRGRPLEVVPRTRHRVASLLERAHRLPLLGRLIPRDRAGELIEVIKPDAELEPASLEPPVPVPLTEPVVAFEDSRGAGATGGRVVTTVHDSGGFSRWALLTGLGASIAVWLAARER